MATIMLVLGFVVFALAGLYGLLALSNVRGGNKELMKAAAAGALTPKSKYTEAGWRYRNRAVLLSVIAVIILLLSSLVG